jgi:hypothetical protein
MARNAFPTNLGNVIPETHSDPDTGTRPRLQLKWDSFALLAAALGCDGTVAQAKLFDFDNKTIRNLRAGGPASDKTVAKVLAIAQANAEIIAAHGLTPDFASFFEVIVDA